MFITNESNPRIVINIDLTTSITACKNTPKVIDFYVGNDKTDWLAFDSEEERDKAFQKIKDTIGARNI